MQSRQNMTKGDVKLTTTRNSSMFGVAFCIAIVWTVTGVGLMALGQWSGIFMIFGSIVSWYYVGKDIAESHSRARVSTN